MTEQSVQQRLRALEKAVQMIGAEQVAASQQQAVHVTLLLALALGFVRLERHQKVTVEGNARMFAIALVDLAMEQSVVFDMGQPGEEHIDMLRAFGDQLVALARRHDAPPAPVH